ncbi:alpha/beta fold hydrolase [Pacificibacter marinus]|uniref:Pimeloyl-[acyl-carrier protein] methyl ester esterase n=1 Tax=Pacificibacter marinus TaxID=658057 RepID=A0A1Y5SRR1_9RHOB|nr:alpha/beta fold hydrolase [Pacificibacter marinus]SEK67547.1 Pimeloyl-ACP methyl ester carboxylesterase [Pacificibacter marinus]SLN46238.1 Pimeloyl-[acyl-carrier protein] methyl ester esterase [Pacificibacter marinus]
MNEAVVLLPGFMADGRVFVDQIPALSQDRAVHVAPLLGATLEDMAMAVLANAPPRFAIVGHDLGATVATEILRRAPDRVTRLALICASAQGETPIASAAREPRMVRAKAGRFGEVLMEELPSTTLADSPHRNAIRDHWVDMALEAGLETYLRQSRIIQRRPDMQNVLRRARLPCIVIGGAANTLAPPRRQEFIAELMPCAEYVLLKGAGHLPMFETPSALTRALQSWLKTEAPFVLR